MSIEARGAGRRSAPARAPAQQAHLVAPAHLNARAAGFGLVVGVDRGGARAGLEFHGADVVVSDLTELSPEAAPTLAAQGA